MRNNLKEELPVSALVHELAPRKGTQRKATQHKWPGVDSNSLCTLLTVLPNALDQLKLLEPVFGDVESR